MNANSLTFGVEIEAFVPADKADYQPGAYHRGNQLAKAPQGWNGQRDSSLHCHTTGHKAVEIVSPILKGEEGLTEVFYMADKLVKDGAIFNGTTGLHIHVGGMDQFSQAQKTKLAKLFRQYEGAFLGLCGSDVDNRLRSTYCKLATSWNTLVDMTTRYRSLNFFTQRPTVEFRIFQATADPAVIVTAVYMCLALVAAVSNMTDAECNQLTPYPRSEKTFSQVAYEFVRKFWKDTTNRLLADERIKDVFATLMSQSAAADDNGVALATYRTGIILKWNR